MPRPTYPTCGGKEGLDVEVAALAGASLRDEARGVDLEIARLLPEDGVESKEEDAKAKIDPHRR